MKGLTTIIRMIQCYWLLISNLVLLIYLLCNPEITLQTVKEGQTLILTPRMSVRKDTSNCVRKMLSRRANLLNSSNLVFCHTEMDKSSKATQNSSQLNTESKTSTYFSTLNLST